MLSPQQSQESSPDRVTLYSLMMKPIQRFPQFILLLQDMLKNTPKGHPDRLPLQMALTELETLAEKLNERKRDADQRCEVRQIAKAVNERHLDQLLSSGSRYLIRSDDVIETVYNDRGEVVKTKERRLFMLNDVLMCATASPRTSHESRPTASQRYLLKWSVPLGHTDVIEYGPSTGHQGRCPTTHAPESLAVVPNAKPRVCLAGDPGSTFPPAGRRPPFLATCWQHPDEADRKAGEEKPEKPQRVGATGGPEEEAEKPVKTKTVSSSNGGERSSRSAEKRSAEEEAADLSTKPTKISEFGFAIGSQTTKKASAISIKLGSGKPEETVPALAPKTLSVAAAFHEDEDSEPEEMPPEAKMRMKNIGRDTPTSAGPNSFNKGKHGFSDNQKLWERNIKSHLGNVHDQDN
ncbi:Hypothetical predicted protein [Marmota monax]|uniref:PEST proteolytic signal-containing nuclear protein n=1 Tax=Marmota monax TaxID=9995 RepID=A0A5E4CCS3_MARMO|nr:Hypothetical predicted protein [Marmota monax]